MTTPLRPTNSNKRDMGDRKLHLAPTITIIQTEAKDYNQLKLYRQGLFQSKSIEGGHGAGGFVLLVIDIFRFQLH
jgi:hypothetical protein